MGVTLYCCHKGSSSKADFVATLVGAPSSFTFRSSILLKETDHNTPYPAPVCPTVSSFVLLLWCYTWPYSTVARCCFTFKTMTLLAFNLDQPRLLYCLLKLGHNQAFPRIMSWFKRNSGLTQMRKSSASGDFYKMIEKTLLFLSSARSNKSLNF